MSADVGDTSERASTDAGTKLCPFSNKFLLISPDRLQALKPRFVNLYSLVDHRRNPDVAVKCFDSFKELVHDIGKNGKFSTGVCKEGSFPRECAKKEGYMKVLLKRM
ncbi:hypothetical protein T440DRAFT_536464 [Plenodomus tracheiphilus IPT5]|uniref:Uncharacterized protein n=1 Tax=Plenodomus tracheiphilus IPT5 TaxID=1408161 RepID=A0A6A7AYF7_9PLEO|nr:hypothetical protein T440DRAFT_536464 [Plenodomus tracheiphilus IPT5]